jgi:hypothetical protein
MRIQTIVKLFGAVMIALLMTGCDEDILDNITDGEPNSVSGGTAEAPAEMSLELRNMIVKNSFFNYYKYTGKEGETLKLESILDFAILSTERIACLEDGETYIAVYDDKMNSLDWIRTCTKNLTVTFPVDGTYIFQIKYPGNKGYFNADSHKP